MAFLRYRKKDPRLPVCASDWRLFKKKLTGLFGEYASYTLDPMLQLTGRPGIRVGWEVHGVTAMHGGGDTWREALAHLQTRKNEWELKWLGKKELIHDEERRILEERRGRLEQWRREKYALTHADHVWIITYAFSYGVLKIPVEIKGKSVGRLGSMSKLNIRWNYGPGQWYRTKREALVAVELKRHSHIAALKKQLHSLQHMKIVAKEESDNG